MSWCLETSSALPTSFVSVSAVQQGNAIAVNFTTANEQNMSSYEVEESANGTNIYQRHKHKSQQCSNKPATIG
ncbi:MAG: hypothetical protein V9E96_01520 [Chitinophagaceae bacterium]